MTLEIFDVEQGTEEWLALRVGVITASASYGLNYKNMRETYKNKLIAERLTGEPTRIVTSGPMQWGIDQEDPARVRYEELTGNKVDQVGFGKISQYVGCSPDGLIGDKGMIEIKCPTTHNFVLQCLKGPKKEYIQQMQFQMWIFDREWNDFCLYDPRVKDPDGQIYIRRMERDEKIIDKIKDNVQTLLLDISKDIKTITGNMKNE